MQETAGRRSGSQSIGERLRIVRGELSQDQFAKKIDIPQVTLSNYERDRNQPKIELIRRICKEFGIDVQWLLFGTEDGEKNSQGARQEKHPEEFFGTAGCDTIGKRIRMLRGAKTQKEFSRLVDIHKSTLGRYERDECSPPADEIRKICETLSVSAEWFLFGDRDGSARSTAQDAEEIGETDACSACQILKELLQKERDECRAKELEIRKLLTENAMLRREQASSCLQPQVS